MNILEAAKAVDMSYPLFIDDWILMQRYPNETSRLNDPIKPFTTTVNCLDDTFIIIACATLYLIALFYYPSFKNICRLDNLIYRPVSSLNKASIHALNQLSLSGSIGSCKLTNICFCFILYESRRQVLWTEVTQPQPSKTVHALISTYLLLHYKT